jgi:predicted nucleotidyltransferase
VLTAVPETEEIWFHGSRAIGKEHPRSDWDILVVLDPRKVNSFMDVQFALQKLKFRNFDIQAASPTGIITKIARDEGKLLWNNTDHLMVEDEPIKISNNNAARAWIERVYAKYPHTMQNNHVMVWGSGDEQQFAMFELVPSFSKRGAVEVKWFQAYPLRAGVGSRAMKELQAMAREDGIALTLFPWDKGQVSQSKLTKFYRGHGFAPVHKGGKSMAWAPE